jgi:hypothetical protein
MNESTQGGTGDLHPAFNNPVTQPANPPPEFHQPANPRSQGHSPALDQRRAQQGQGQNERPNESAQPPQQAEPGKVTIEGVDYNYDQVRSAIARQVEEDTRKASLPQDPRGYEIKLPANFQAPQGLKFEFDRNSPELQRFRQLAHARGVDQETFSDMLGVYAATKIGEAQTIATARNAEVAKLGSAATRRIDAIETWLKARVGSDANLIVAQMRNFPVASMVTAFEKIIGEFGNQGGANYSQSGRYEAPQNDGRIAGYETMTFEQKRAAQETLNARLGRRR